MANDQIMDGIAPVMGTQLAHKANEQEQLKNCHIVYEGSLGFLCSFLTLTFSRSLACGNICTQRS